MFTQNTIQKLLDASYYTEEDLRGNQVKRQLMFFKRNTLENSYLNGTSGLSEEEYNFQIINLDEKLDNLAEVISTDEESLNKCRSVLASLQSQSVGSTPAVAVA